jgi:WD40 repeat protein
MICFAKLCGVAILLLAVGLAGSEGSRPTTAEPEVGERAFPNGSSGSSQKDQKKSDLPTKDEVDAKTILALIKQLGDDNFEVREAADKKLMAIGEPALELLRQAAKADADAEVRLRAGQLARTILSAHITQVRSFRRPTKSGAVFTRVLATPDGKRILAAGYDGLHTWDLESGNALVTFGVPKNNTWALCLSPDATRLLTSHTDKVVRLYELDSGKPLQEFQGHTNIVWAVLFLPGGKQVLTGAWDQSIRVWDIESGKEIRTFEGVRDNVRCMALSPDGKTVAAGHFTKSQAPGTVRLWDVPSGKEIRTMEGHGEEVSSVTFSPDGKTILTSGYDKTLRLWDPASGKELLKMTGTPLHYMEWAAFTPDGKRIVSCGTEGAGTDFSSRSWTLRLWDAATGKQILESDPINGGVLCVAALPDNRQCLTASRDGVIRLWRWTK